jgi:hypothetical protein
MWTPVGNVGPWDAVRVERHFGGHCARKGMHFRLDLQACCKEQGSKRWVTEGYPQCWQKHPKEWQRGRCCS